MADGDFVQSLLLCRFMSVSRGRADTLCSERVIPGLTQSRLSTSRQLRNRLPERPRSSIPRSLALPFSLYLVSLPLLLNTLLLLMPQVFKVLIPDQFLL
jgi:hypothetical protein